MNRAVVAAIVKKELVEARRDLRSLVLLALLPALLYPTMLYVAARLGSAGGAKLQAAELVVVVEEGLPEDVEAALARIERVVRVAPSDTRASRADARVGLDPADAQSSREARRVVVTLDRATERGMAAEQRLVVALVAARENARDERLRALGVDEAALTVAPVDVIDTAPPARKGGFLLSRAVVPLLVLMILIGAYYPAVETTVGERERQTLRTLLCAPVDATSIALGKLVVVSLLAMIAGTANLAGLALTARIGFLSSTGFTIPLSALALTVVLLVPLAVLLAAILMATASLASTSREAQTLLTPLSLVVTVPAVAPSFPGITPSIELAFVPVFGIALTIRELMGGTASVGLVAAALAGGLATVVVALAIAARAFTVEALLTGRVARKLRASGPLELFDAFLLALALVATLVISGGALAGADPIVSVVGVQLTTFLVVPLVFVVVRTRAPLDALGLVRPEKGTLLVVVGALLCLPTLGAVGARFATKAVGEDELTQFRALAERMESLHPAVVLVVFALLPAVVEEIAFRGALQRAFARVIRIHGVWVTAVLFALFHGSFARTLPTLLVGLLAGYVAYVSRSTFSSMIVHGAHNGFALALGLLLTTGGARDVDVALAGDPYRALPLAAHALVVPGVVCLVLGWRRSRAVLAAASVPD